MTIVELLRLLSYLAFLVALALLLYTWRNPKLTRGAKTALLGASAWIAFNGGLTLAVVGP